jgi:hypothetical protein
MALEHELTPGTVFSIEYSGSIGKKLYSIANLNRVGSGLEFLGTTTPRPFASTPTSRLNGSYTNINFRGNSGFSKYDGLTFSLESSNFKRRLGPLNFDGLQFTARYTLAYAHDNLSSTFSESGNNFNLGFVDPYNPHLDYGFSDFDVRHRFSGSFNYDIPFFRNTKGFARQALDGFTLTGIVTARTGTPFTVYDCTNASFTTCIRAEHNGLVRFSGDPHPPVDPSQPNRFQYIDLSGLAPSTFTDIAGGTEVGPFPTNMIPRNSFRAPGNYNINAGLYKRFKLTERYSLQLRSEFYNLLNHANTFIRYGEADVSSSSFVPAYRDGRRNIQLAAKFIF